MRKIPIWEFVKISKDHYLSLSKIEKLKLMINHIQVMKNEVNDDLFI